MIREVVEKDGSDEGGGEDNKEFSTKTLGKVSSCALGEEGVSVRLLIGKVGRRLDEVKTSVNSVGGVVICL